jgi:membrane protease YdiL (CAAX protease family)
MLEGDMDLQPNVAFAVASALLQVLFFAAGPFVAYVATRRRVRGFGHYVGVRPCPPAALLAAFVVFAVTAPLVAAVYLIPSLRAVALSGTSAASRIAALDVAASSVAIIVVVSFIQTGLAEELLFRGFIAKRLIAWLGFQRGNAVQALIFVVPHLLLFLGPQGAAFGPAGLALVVVTAATMAWLFGWLNERRGDGSIAPSWLAHGLANTLAYTVALLL